MVTTLTVFTLTVFLVITVLVWLFHKPPTPIIRNRWGYANFTVEALSDNGFTNAMMSCAIWERIGECNTLEEAQEVAEKHSRKEGMTCRVWEQLPDRGKKLRYTTQ